MHFFLLLLFVLGVTSHNMTMIEKIKADPKKFVEEMAKVDPTKLQEIIDLLEALRVTSHAEESDLLGTLDGAKIATENAAVAVADAEKEKRDADDDVVTAQEDLETTKTTAETNIGTAASALASRKSEADDAQNHLDDMIGAHHAREAEQADAQADLDGELPSLNSEQETLINVIEILSGLIAPDACSGGTVFGWAVENKVAACQGSFTGHPNNAGLCSDGWHTCNGEDVHNRFAINKAQASSFSGCFAYDSMNDCHGCWMHCEDGATPVKSGGCLDSGHGHDLAGMGSGCSVGGTSPACLVDTRSNIAGYGRSGCNVNSVPTEGGVMCCKDERKYWVIGPIGSTEVSDDDCGSGGVLVRPKTHAEQEHLFNAMQSLDLTGQGASYGGAHIWIGGRFDANSGSWKWNDGTPITGETNWASGQGNPASGPSQPYLGMERSNGKWHDYNGQGSEANPGFMAICQG